MFSTADVNNALAQVVDRVNSTADEDGLMVMRVPPGNRGYGLVATREFREGEWLTEYGGVPVDPATAEGEYVVQLESAAGRLAYDAHHGFRPDQRGRWINDPADVIYANESEARARERWDEKSNVDLQRDPDGTLWFLASRNIGQGEEVLWYYGNEYVRPWVQRVDVFKPVKRGRIAMACIECGVSGQRAQLYMCGDCEDVTQVWCGQRCGRASGHHKICPN